MTKPANHEDILSLLTYDELHELRKIAMRSCERLAIKTMRADTLAATTSYSEAHSDMYELYHDVVWAQDKLWNRAPRVL